MFFGSTNFIGLLSFCQEVHEFLCQVLTVFHSCLVVHDRPYVSHSLGKDTRESTCLVLCGADVQSSGSSVNCCCDDMSGLYEHGWKGKHYFMWLQMIITYPKLQMPESEIDPGRGGRLNGQMGRAFASSCTSSTILSSFSRVFTLLATSRALRSFLERSFAQGMITLLFIGSLKLEGFCVRKVAIKSSFPIFWYIGVDDLCVYPCGWSQSHA